MGAELLKGPRPRAEAGSERLHLTPVVGGRLLLLLLLRRKVLGWLRVVECFAQDASRADRRVQNLFSNLGVDDLHNGSDELAGCVVLATVATLVPHALDAVLKLCIVITPADSTGLLQD